VGNLYKEGCYSNAKTISQKILEIDPEHSFMLYLFGFISRPLGKNNLAFELIEKVLIYDPNYVDLHFNLWNALKDQNQLLEAL
jgi:tetratricopeptide (TPR) repeat protein